ncbi:hypothetical protein DID76_04070, partial [Candidatus Marinamargulisbacteria bacterium SCGC AG-414-C22]
MDLRKIMAMPKRASAEASAAALTTQGVHRDTLSEEAMKWASDNLSDSSRLSASITHEIAQQLLWEIAKGKKKPDDLKAVVKV